MVTDPPDGVSDDPEWQERRKQNAWAFYVASILDMLFGSRGHLLDLFAMVIFGTSLVEVTPALWASLWLGWRRSDGLGRAVLRRLR